MKEQKTVEAASLAIVIMVLFFAMAALLAQQLTQLLGAQELPYKTWVAETEAVKRIPPKPPVYVVETTTVTLTEVVQVPYFDPSKCPPPKAAKQTECLPPKQAPAPVGGAQFDLFDVDKAIQETKHDGNNLTTTEK